ncbi:Histone-binding protein rbbp4 [Entomophthora muscae]|uniref:Histone-binding protein rbbp4 n=1 Tax=Entomophthora muscae TaxID=34485 RepID=A0ACC2S1Z1_9FUNG|nr:Histone-binding protein rbbp4 [Entomophthora muscae]
MPQKPDIIGTFSSTGKVFIFDRTRHPSDPPEDGKCRPEIELQGHLKEGFGLSWSPMSEGNLLTASADKTICHWYFLHIMYFSFKRMLLGTRTMIQFLGLLVMISRMMIWDMRKGSSQPVNSILAHSANANCIGFSPSSDTVLATAGSDNVVNLWDLRNLNSKVHSLIGHEDEIRSLSWSPTEPTILASAGLDRRLLIWDVSRIGEHQSPEDAEDGPPELMFLHGGHTDLISDLSWNLNRPWTMASVAEDNVCQIWQVAQNIYNIEEVPQSSEVKE